MDSQTHVALASRFLNLCGGNPSLNIVSLFPQIDRTPPTLHRMYAHTVYRAKELCETGLAVIISDSQETTDLSTPSASYAIKRFTEERTRILAYNQDFDKFSIASLSSSAKHASLMAYVSHLYLDTYNQPTQPFAPQSVFPSGQWALWETLGDFRLRLYTTPIINELRVELFAQPLWQSASDMSAIALTQAMLTRVRDFGLDMIPEIQICNGMQSLGLPLLTQKEIETSIEFLETFEDILSALHIKHLNKNTTISIAKNSHPNEQILTTEES